MSRKHISSRKWKSKRQFSKQHLYKTCLEKGRKKTLNWQTGANTEKSSVHAAFLQKASQITKNAEENQTADKEV